MSELDFTHAFEKYLKRRSLQDFPGFSAIYREVNGFQGVPDLVTIHGPKPKLNQIRVLKKVLDQEGRASLSILSLFVSGKAHSIEFVAKRVRISTDMIQRSLNALESLGILERTNTNNFTIATKHSIPNFEIWAFELKMSNWKRALFQTTQAKAFADKAVAVFPIEREDLVRTNFRAFKKMRVGLLLFDAEKMTHKFVVKPTNSLHKIDYFKLYTLAQIAKGD